MAKLPIPEELDALIQEYLTDGILTDKERAVILKKAVGMGLNHDEIDLYLDAQVQKIDQATDAITRKQKGKVCPYCGGSVPLLADKCPHCGENVTPEASKELQDIIDNLEEALINIKEAKDYKHSKATIERYARKAKMYYGNNPKIQKLLEEVHSEMEMAIKGAKKKAIKQSIINALVWLTIKPLIWLITKPLTWAVICATIAVVWGIYGEKDEKYGIVNGAFYFGVAAAIIAMFSFMASENEKESNHK